jgi:hypothetical protein
MKANLTNAIKQHLFYNCHLNFKQQQVDVLRIVIASYSLFSIILLLLDYPVFLASDGLINWEVTNANSYWFELHPEKLATLLHISKSTIVAIILFLYLGSLLFLLIGIWVRVSAVFALLMFVALGNTLSPYGYGVDVYHTVTLFFLCVFPTGYFFTFQHKKKYSSLATIQALSIRVFQIYLCLTYLNAGVEKD